MLLVALVVVVIIATPAAADNAALSKMAFNGCKACHGMAGPKNKCPSSNTLKPVVV